MVEESTESSALELVPVPTPPNRIRTTKKTTGTRTTNSSLLFPVNAAERIALIQRIAAKNRPHFAPSGGFGYSGSQSFQREEARIEALKNVEKYNGDFSIFLQDKFQDFYAEPELVDEQSREEAAQIIAERLHRAQLGSKRKAAMWKDVAIRGGVDVVEEYLPGRSRGKCMPSLFDECGALGGVIYVNTAYPREDQARVYVHELAHLILFSWIAPTSIHDVELFQYDGDRHDAAHDVARRVERLVLGG